MAYDSDSIRTPPYRTTGETMTWCFIVHVQVKLPARAWHCCSSRRALGTFARLPEGFMAGALEAFPSVHLLSRQSKAPKQTEFVRLCVSGKTGQNSVGGDPGAIQTPSLQSPPTAKGIDHSSLCYSGVRPMA